MASGPRIPADGVVFDMDGCLVDSEPLCLGVIADEMQALGLVDVTTEEIGSRFLGVSLSKIEDFAAQRLGRPLPAGFAERIEARVLQIYQTELRQIPGALDMLARLKAQQLGLGLATGASVHRMRGTLGISGLETWFTDTAVSAEEVRAGKPAPDIFLATAERLGLAPARCVVVEDSPHGVTGALRAGMRAIGFVGGSHLQGRRTEQTETLLQAGATQVFDRLETLCDFILSTRKADP